MDLTIYKNMWPGYILSILENEITNFHNGNLEVKVQLNVCEARLIKQSAPILLYKFPDGASTSLSMKEFLINKWKIDTTEFTNFRDDVVFVAIKNGRHDKVGYYLDSNRKPNDLKNVLPVHKIFDFIMNHFKL